MTERAKREVWVDVTEQSDAERTPAKPKAERVRPATPDATMAREAKERMTTYAAGTAVERLGAHGGTERWVIDNVDDRGTVFMTAESGKRAIMHETEVALEARAAVFAPTLDAAWGKTLDMIADMTDDDDVGATGAMLKEHRGDILFLAAERLAANPEADPARELLGAVRETERRLHAEKQLSEFEAREREANAEAKAYLGFSPEDAAALSHADIFLSHMRFGSMDHEGFSPDVRANRHDITAPQLQEVGNARATVAELAVLHPDLRDEILGDIPDIVDHGRSVADIDAELKKVVDDLSFTEAQWRAHGKGGKDSPEAIVHFTVTRKLRKREMALEAERRLAAGNTRTTPEEGETTVPRHEATPESDEVTRTLSPRRRTAPRARTIGKNDGKGPTAEAPVDFLTIPPLKDFARDSARNTKQREIARRTGESRKRLDEARGRIMSDTYVPPTQKEQKPVRRHLPARNDRSISEDEWMAEGERGENLRGLESDPLVDRSWYFSFAKDFGGSQDFQRMHAEARARTRDVHFTLEDLKHSNPISRWFYLRQMRKAVKEMVRQDAARTAKRRGKLQS